MSSNVELLASYWTISAGHPHTDREYSPFDFKDRVESAARAGFRGFGIWHQDLDHVLQNYSLREMKQILDGNGIKHVELEFLTDWFLDGERKHQSDLWRKKLLHAAEVLGARHVKVGDFYQEPHSLPRVIDEFAVPIPGPRRIDSAQVAELASTITDRLREEMSRHGQAQ